MRTYFREMSPGVRSFMKPATSEWVGKAEDDYRAAEELHRSHRRFHDQVCFHCQQSAEKYFKAILEEDRLSVPRTHDLELLLNLLFPDHPTLRPLRRGV